MEEYKEVVAQCDKVGGAYRQDADEYRKELESLTADYAAYDAETKALKAEYNGLEQKRQDVLTREASLQTARQQTASRFNELRERLIALQSTSK
jgi:chromosome segregation ATPase